MKQTLKGVGIGLSPEQIAELDSFAQAKGLSRSEVIRIAIAVGLPLLKLGIAINARRFLAITEHTQMALSMIVEREYPDVADEILRLAESNVDHYHS